MITWQKLGFGNHNWLQIVKTIYVLNVNQNVYIHKNNWKVLRIVLTWKYFLKTVAFEPI